MSSVDAMHQAFYIKDQKKRNIAENMGKKEG